MKLVDVNSGNYAEYEINSSDEDRKSQVDGHIRISK